MLTTNNTPVTSGSAGKTHGHNNNRSLRLSRQPAAIRYSALAGLGALLLVAAPAAWSSTLHPYNSSYGYGAGTSFSLNLYCTYVPNCDFNNPPALMKTSGGDGQVSTSDSSNLVGYGATAAGSARADAITGQLGSYGSNAALYKVKLQGHNYDASGQTLSESEFYNTYTLVGPVGLTPTINLVWNIHGDFSHATNTYYGPNGSAELFVSLLAPKYEVGLGSGEVSDIVDKGAYSVDGQAADLSGTLDLGAAYKSAAGGNTLTTGDSFTLDAFLRVINSDRAAYKITNTNFVASDFFASDFLHTAGLTLTSSDPRVTLRSATDGLSTVPIPAAVWLFGSGLLGLIGVGRRRC